MIRIGDRVTLGRRPAVVGGELTYVNFGFYAGRWAVLCFVPSLGLAEAVVLDRNQGPIGQLGGQLFVVSALPRELAQLDGRGLRHVRVPVLADPLKRLSRRFGVGEASGAGRCHTFLIAPDRRLRCRLVHDLTGRWAGVLLEALRNYRDSERVACLQS